MIDELPAPARNWWKISLDAEGRVGRLEDRGHPAPAAGAQELDQEDLKLSR